MTRPIRPLLRGPLGLVGVAVVLAGLWVALVSVIIGIVPQAPNPYVMDGDPCCAIPDTWKEVREGAVAGWIALMLGTTVATLGALLVAAAIRGRFARWRWLPCIVGGIGALAAVAIVVDYVRLDDLEQVKRCREARVELKGYRGADAADQERLLKTATGTCDLLTGMTQADVEELLGPPAEKTQPDGPKESHWGYTPGHTRLHFVDGRVSW